MDASTLLNRRLVEVLGAGLASTLLVACGPRVDSNTCITVAEADECPDVDAAADELVGRELCTSPVQTVLEVLGYSERVDATGWGDTGGDNPDYDACCYDVLVREQTGASCVVGRPLVHDGATVAAPIRKGRSPWAAADRPDVSGLSRQARRVLARHWLRTARDEHASVAAFAQVALELMAFGAPPDLVAGAHAAAADEVRHATRAFALASAYAGEALGPGRLRVPERHFADLASLAAATAAEGCLGETLATLVAAEELTVAEDPAVRAALAEVVADEARHAALAWAILRWTVSAGGEPAKSAAAGVLADLESAIESFCRPLSPEHPPGVRAHGLLTSNRVRSALRTGAERVIRPAAADLLS